MVLVICHMLTWIGGSKRKLVKSKPRSDQLVQRRAHCPTWIANTDEAKAFVSTPTKHWLRVVDGNKCDEKYQLYWFAVFRMCRSGQNVKKICFLFFPALKVNLGSFTKFGNSNIPTSVDSKFMQITTQHPPSKYWTTIKLFGYSHVHLQSCKVIFQRNQSVPNLIWRQIDDF